MVLGKRDDSPVLSARRLLWLLVATPDDHIRKTMCVEYPTDTRAYLVPDALGPCSARNTETNAERRRSCLDDLREVDAPNLIELEPSLTSTEIFRPLPPRSPYVDERAEDRFAPAVNHSRGTRRALRTLRPGVSLDICQR